MFRALALVLLFASSIVSAEAFAARIAMIQYDADLHFGETKKNLAALEKMADEAVLNGASVIILPEGSSHGYAKVGASEKRVWCLNQHDYQCRNVRDVAEKLVRPAGTQGSVTAFWHAFAQRTGATVVASVIEEDGGYFYNTAVTVGPRGIIASYRKRALYYINELYAASGRSPVVVDLGFGKVGFLICADGNVSPYYEEYKRLGANTIILTMDWDQSPNARSSRSAKNFFTAQAQAHGMTIIASDVSRWDGTGLYLPNGTRVRDGLSEPAVGVNGITYAELQ